MENANMIPNTEVPGPSQAAPAPSTSMPTVLGPQTCGGKKSMKIAGINMPGNQYQIAAAPPTARAGPRVIPEKQCTSSVAHSSRSGHLGTEGHHVGEKVQRGFVCRNLRTRSKLCEVDPGPRRFPQRGYGRLRQLLHHSASSRRSCSSTDRELSAWQPIPGESMRFRRSLKSEFPITDHEEVQWMKEVYKDGSKRE